jgi:50S ribosomal protein L16 3-hydroxylase
MDPTHSTPLLGGLTYARFMQRHWQKKPLLVRQAIAGIAPPLKRGALLAMAANDEVESRLVVRTGERWTLRHGPLPRRALPPLTRPGWTLLVQGLDLHVEAARGLLDRFRFLPEARLDDLMVSYASDGGGVGPHVDSYDVFLLQVQGRRRWQIARPGDRRLVSGLPMKILAHFAPEQEWVLEPGDLLYLPPGWSHDGVAVGGDCMTCSIGLRAPARTELARSVLQFALDETEVPETDLLYRDPRQPATPEPGRIPEALAAFAVDAVARFAGDTQALACALGEVLSEPKPRVRFDEGETPDWSGALRLDRRSRMLYDDDRVYLNGESYRASGREARAMHRLADARRLGAADVARLGTGARQVIGEWWRAGWVCGDRKRRTAPEEADD